ncbi:MAG TPA: sialidase family protein [Candidatus Didemnitutus sp.]|nr:sialidase family protein [Candidatus Didemnitutus sp.]
MMIFFILVSLFLSAILVRGEEHVFPLPSYTMGRQNTNVTISPEGDVLVSFVTPLKAGYRIGIAVSNDGGVTWRVTDSIAYMRASMIGLQRRPTVFKSNDGSLVCSYEDQKVGDAMPRVYVTRTTAENEPWSTPIAVVRGDQAAMQDFSSMASSGDGRLAIAFIGDDPALSGRQVYVVLSKDYGRSWSDPLQVNSISWKGSACECCMTSVAYSRSGVLGVAFRANRNNVRDIHVAFSTNNGVSFDKPVLIQDGKWTISGCPSTGPNLMFDENDVAHMSWRDYRDVVLAPVVYYAKCRVGDTVTPRNVDLSSVVAEDADYPAVSVSPDGKIVTIIHESSNGVRITVSRDGGETFESRVVDPFIKRNSSCHVIEIPNGTSIAIWTSINDGRFDVAKTVGSVTSIYGQCEQLSSAVGHQYMPLYTDWVTVPDHATISGRDVAGRVVELEVTQSSPRRVRPVAFCLTFISTVLPEGVQIYAIIRSE